MLLSSWKEVVPSVKMAVTTMLFVIFLVSIGITVKAEVKDYFQCTKPSNVKTRNTPRYFVTSTEDDSTMITSTSSSDLTTSQILSNSFFVENGTPLKTDTSNHETTPASSSDPLTSGTRLSTTFNENESTESSTVGLTTSLSSKPPTSKITMSSSVGDGTTKNDINTETTTASSSELSTSERRLSSTCDEKESSGSSTAGLTTALSSKPSTSKIRSISSSVGDETTKSDINSETTTASSSDASKSERLLSTIFDKTDSIEYSTAGPTFALSSKRKPLTSKVRSISSSVGDETTKSDINSEATTASSSDASTSGTWSSTTFVDSESTVSSTHEETTTNELSTSRGVTSRVVVIDVNTPNCPDLTLLHASYTYLSGGSMYTSTYYLSTISKTWPQSLDACTCIQNAHLVFTETIEEKDNVVDAFKAAENSGAHFWTGLNYSGGLWKWHDSFGDHEYLEWAGNGVTGGKACSVMHKTVGLQTKKCDDQFLFICEVQTRK